MNNLEEMKIRLFGCWREKDNKIIPYCDRDVSTVQHISIVCKIKFKRDVSTKEYIFSILQNTGPDAP